MSTTDADKITAEFDNNIFTKITSVFGQPSDVDNNGKTNILCFDIKDGFSGSGGYVAGYFDPSDLYAYDSIYNPKTNQMEVFYIDTYPAMGTSSIKDVTKCYGTLAHEFQHMVNWNQNIFVENNDPNTGDMDIWLNEGLSEAASQVYTGQISQSRIDYYNWSNTITSGTSLLKWDSTLENYSLSYLFMEYLKEQVGIGDNIFTEITQSTYNDYRSVEQAIKKYIDPNLTFGQFMTSFRVALMLKKSTGLYGFKGKTGYNTINQKLYSGSAVDLYGGGAIVVAANAVTGELSIPSNKGSTINYFIVQNPPIITIGAYNTSLTNQDITVSASADVGTLNETAHTFTQNGSFDFVATNSTGDITTKTVTITNIDKTPPIVSGITSGSSYNIAAISFNEGTATLNGLPFSNGGVIRNGGSYLLVVSDLAGNSSVLHFTIANTPFVYSDEKLTGVYPNISLAVLKSNVNMLSDETAKIYNKNNVEITDSNAIIGTGMLLRIYQGNTVKDMETIIIYGDVSGDGAINLMDLTAVKQHLLKSSLLDGAYKTAGDLSKKGSISISDLIMLKKQILGLQTISQS